MLTTKSLYLILLAGTALAAPSADPYWKRQACGGMITTPQGWSFPNCFGACAGASGCPGGGAPPAPPAPPAPAAPAPAPAAPQPQQKQEQQSQPSQPSGGSGGSGGNSEVDLVNKYRGIMHKSNLAFDGKLLGNIQKTLKDHPGQMVHELNPGSGGQVLAQGDCGNFENSLVHGWICEIPSLLPGGMCNGGNYNLGGQTGHAEILSSSSYSKVACACNAGIWGCDFGS